TRAVAVRNVRRVVVLPHLKLLHAYLTAHVRVAARRSGRREPSLTVVEVDVLTAGNLDEPPRLQAVRHRLDLPLHVVLLADHLTVDHLRLSQRQFLAVVDAVYVGDDFASHALLEELSGAGVPEAVQQDPLSIVRPLELLVRRRRPVGRATPADKRLSARSGRDRAVLVEGLGLVGPLVLPAPTRRRELPGTALEDPRQVIERPQSLVRGFPTGRCGLGSTGREQAQPESNSSSQCSLLVH